MARTLKLAPFAVAIAIAAVVAVVLNMGGSGGGQAATATGTPTSISVAGSPLGQMLVDGSGRTLYLFEADKSTMSTCNDACAQAWPPLVTTGNPTAGAGANAAALGTTQRADGSTQVTYSGHPLYHYIADQKPGDTFGQGLNQFGAKWYVLSPAGNKIDND